MTDNTYLYEKLTIHNSLVTMGLARASHHVHSKRLADDVLEKKCTKQDQDKSGF